LNILFICSRNQWRSPTGEALFRNSAVHEARSAGTAGSARVRVSERLVEWADIIFAMERHHRDILRERFNTEMNIVVLDIPDEYQYMDEELVQMLRDGVGQYVDMSELQEE